MATQPLNLYSSRNFAWLLSPLERHLRAKKKRSNSGQPFLKYFWDFYFHTSEKITRSLGKKCRKRPPKLSLYCFKVVRTSNFLGIPFTFGPLIHKQLAIYCKIIITSGLQIDLKFIMILFFRELNRYHVTMQGRSLGFFRGTHNSPNRFALRPPPQKNNWVVSLRVFFCTWNDISNL